MTKRMGEMPRRTGEMMRRGKGKRGKRAGASSRAACGSAHIFDVPRHNPKGGFILGNYIYIS